MPELTMAAATSANIEQLLEAACCEPPTVECSVLAKELLQFVGESQCDSSEPLAWIQEYLMAHLTLVSWSQVHTRVLKCLSKKQRKCIKRALAQSMERACKAEAWAELFKHVSVDETLDPCSDKCSSKTRAHMSMYLHFSESMYMKAYGNRLPSMIGLFLMTNFNKIVLKKLLAHKYWSALLTNDELACLVDDLASYTVCMEDRSQLMMEYTRLMRGLRVDRALLDCLNGALSRPDKLCGGGAKRKSSAENEEPMRSLDDISDDEEDVEPEDDSEESGDVQASIGGSACRTRQCAPEHDATNPCALPPLPNAARCPQPWTKDVERMIDSLPSIQRFRDQIGLGCYVDARLVLHYFYLANFGADKTWRTIAYEQMSANEALLTSMARYRTNALPMPVGSEEWMRILMAFYTASDTQRAAMGKLPQVAQFQAALKGVVAPRVLKMTDSVTMLQQLITIYMPEWDVLWRDMRWITSSEVVQAIADYKKTAPVLTEESVDAILKLLPQL